MSVVPSREFDLPGLPAPYFLQVYAYSPPGTPAQTFRYRLELRERRRVLGVPWWPRLVTGDEVTSYEVSDPKRRRFTVARFLRRLVDEGYVAEEDLPAKALRER
ncbi:hypothetical protein QE364_000783 [Nocardioides zeae]|uniref:Uncharacterized protein n=1 Tax=Nocardioides zeae TaxID=1457234 RepID=A0ACC6IEA3_9ACTN|nr:hypothetical protein [Nocardioides zeae]MDR6174286.1 hypothetical protein [Nocardioides zeae]MDR6209091.1 hypothetical protein [Nocardioides zeae]